ncbi:alpha/beta hydrolase [Sphingomonas sp. Leaf343]|uniref:alpha/beta hydrolase n=1 Tax=Sphingomonas sp. Leaf343 TaxID=1736345 RepID=UPI0006FCEC11|nr:alpha/beta hydrolase [Sphingomonas sp. Leaf343]KQR83192.1 poly-beta-hydroxybutyrate polymerase [Sphingomonas sp. Leaf343]
MLRSETAKDPARRAAALLGLARYQAARREHGLPPLKEVRRHGRVTLRGTAGEGTPVVLVPSLINPPAVLDLSEDRSLLRWLGAQGFAAWLLDWGEPVPAERDLSVTGHVESLLLPLLATFDRPPVLVGYCLGGTMALAAAARARVAGAQVAGVATMAAPWKFEGYGPARDAIAAMWRGAQPTCEALGLVPMEVLQAGFWQLDPARTIAKFEAFGRMDPDSAQAKAFIRLEDWSNAGAPLTYAAGAELFAMIADDAPGRGMWRVGGDTVDPAALGVPAVEFVSTTDRIVPAATAAGLPDHRDIASGHVGMIVGGRARATLWQPLADWIAALPSPT